MTLPLLPDVEADAIVSPDGLYRYALTRKWEDGPDLVWVMLNPSTADATEDDPTIRKCQKFAQTWGFSGISVVNLFAYRATDPADLLLVDDPVGPGNDVVLQAVFEEAGNVMAAWGAATVATYRADPVLDLMADANRTPYVLGLTKAGAPRHPLYIRDTTSPQEWKR